MNTISIIPERLACGLGLLAVLSAGGAPAAEVPTPVAEERPELLDAVWVWAIAEGVDAYEIGKELVSTADPGRFAQADAPSKAAILGVRNIFMAGNGLPGDLAVARKLSGDIRHLGRVVWEINPDDAAAPGIYARKLKTLAAASESGPPLAAVLLDDPLRFKPSDSAALRAQLQAWLTGVPLWGVVYVHHIGDPQQDQHLEHWDGILLATWNPEDLRSLEPNVDRVAKMAPAKPILLVLYMYDYHQNRKMPRDLMQLQCEKALALARQGRIRGLVFIAVNNDAETIAWTRDWIRANAQEPISGR